MEDQGQLLRIFIGESDRYDNRPLYEVIITQAHKMDLAGATVLKGLAGFGHGRNIHTAKILRLTENLPVVVEIVDRKENINKFKQELELILDNSKSGGLITLEDIHWVQFYHDE